MTTNYPGALDSFTNPQATDKVATVSHAAQHANANDAIEALQAKVGIDGSAVTSSHDYKLQDVADGDKACAQADFNQVDNTSDATKNAAVATLTNKTINADNNTISNLEVDNFKANVIDTDTAMTADSDTRIPTQAAVKAFVEASVVGGTQFPGSTAFNNTAPTSYTDLDLSSIVGAAQRCVLLLVTQQSATATTYKFRPNGATYSLNDSDTNMVGASTTGNLLQNNAAIVVLTTDTAGVVEWKASGARSTKVEVLAYW